MVYFMKCQVKGCDAVNDAQNKPVGRRILETLDGKGYLHLELCKEHEPVSWDALAKLKTHILLGIRSEQLHRHANVSYSIFNLRKRVREELVDEALEMLHDVFDNALDKMIDEMQEKYSENRRY